MKTVLWLFFSLFLVPLHPSAQEKWPFLDSGEGVQSIILMGDTNIQHRKNPGDAFQFVIGTLNQADFRMLNLEGPFAGGTDDSTKTDIPHKDWRHSNPDQVVALTSADIDAVGVANNVTYPWQALMRSLRVLDSVGIPYAGGGKNLLEAHQPVIIEKKGLKVGFMQYAATVFPTDHAAMENQPGIAEIKVHTAYQPPKNLDKPGQPPIVITWMDKESKERMVNDIKKLRNQVDIVITSFHWGVSGTETPVSYQTDIAQTVIDSGADVVFGHGPHKYQKVEVYKGKPILYSLGQGVFDDLRGGNRSKRNREGLLARITVKGKKVNGVSLVPTWREDDNYLRLYDPNHGKGQELWYYLNRVNENGAHIEILNKEIRINGLFD